MKIIAAIGVLAISLVMGCSSSEPTSITDGVSQSAIDDYNAMIEAEAKQVSEDASPDSDQ